MKHPKVTVLMSAYNAEKYIREAVDSILNQTYKDFEFLIFEDASTDKTKMILQVYSKKDKRIKLIEKKENKGYVGYLENLNKGLKMAKGEYVARMDADDISMPTRLEKQVKKLDRDKKLAVIGTGAENIYEDGTHNSWFFPITSQKKIRRVLPRRNCIYHPTIMLRNDPDLRYRLHYVEDYDLWLQILKSGMKIDNLVEPLVKYRILEHSLSRGRGMKTTAATIAAQEVYKGNIEFEDLDIERFVSVYELDVALKENLIRMFTLAFESRNYPILDDVYEEIVKRFDTPLWVEVQYRWSTLKREIASALHRF